ncbi:uncharacterized protein [Arachis hypogaea]|uniref:uncharacterized protein n=1 Tax=Arachis hypogaea TaxID=3818 RepID=UPI003B2136E1
MYYDLKKMFWWPGMKGDAATVVSKCLTCQKVKIEHQKPSGMLQPLDIPQWKWEGIAMEFVTGLPRTRSGFDTYETTEASVLAPDLVAETTKKIKKIQRRKPLGFEEHVFLRVTPTTGIGRAIKTKKLNPRYIGPFEILRRFGPVAYQVALLPHLSNLYDVFHMSQLCKYTSDAAHVLDPESVELRENLTFQVTPVRIDDTNVKKLREKEVQLVKVAWKLMGGKMPVKNFQKLFSKMALQAQS